MGDKQAAYGPLADLMSAAEVARTLKVSRATVRSWFDRGLRRYRLGVRDWVSEAELYAFVKERLGRGPGLPKRGAQSIPDRHQTEAD